MARRKHTAEQVINKPREAEVAISAGSTVAEASRQLGVTQQPSTDGVPSTEAQDRSGRASEATGDGEQPSEESGSRSDIGQPEC